VTVSTRRYVGTLIAQHSDILFFYVCGNHDRDVPPIFPDDCIPQNWVDLSGQGWTSVSLPCEHVSITVSATSGFDSATYESVPRVDGLHIVMLHGQITQAATVGRDVVSLPRLAGKGIDYLALGHEHSYRSDRLDAHGVWCYSGCPEGRGFDECGEKGVVLLEVSPDGGLRHEFLPIARRTMHRLTLSVQPEDDAHAIELRMQEAVASIPERDMVLLDMRGECLPEHEIDADRLALWLRDRFFTAKLEDHTTLALRAEDYMYDVSLKGEFIRTVMASKLPLAKRDRVILCGLRALRGEEAEL
ncbi:MAG: DNA repair exonuclease, partial [Clostridia bacterium]|nr:DNA repair exonuclease [Clostridia bacterium]